MAIIHLWEIDGTQGFKRKDFWINASTVPTTAISGIRLAESSIPNDRLFK